MSVILFPGLVPPNNIKEIVSNNVVDVSLIIIKEKYLADYSDFCSGTIITKESLIYEKEKKHLEMKEYYSCIRHVFNDYRTIMIAERHFRYYGVYSALNINYKVESLICNVIEIIKDKKPQKVIFQATPHGVYTWVFAKVCEYFGVDVCFNKMSLLDDLFYPVRGLDEQNLIPVIENELIKSNQDDLISGFIEQKNKTYQDAIPEYEYERMTRYKGKYFSWIEEFKALPQFGSKHFVFRAIESLRKFKCYKCYTSLAKFSFNSNEKYIVYFLHFQPERTSLPEGGMFNNQLSAIRYLSVLARKLNMNVLVKVHPSMFRQPWDSSARSSFFYQTINEIDNVHLVSMDCDSYQLIELASVTATITGTIISESLLKSTPVIVFGTMKYPEVSGLIKFDNDNLFELIENIIGNGFDKNEFIEYLHDMQYRSFKWTKEINTSVDSYKYMVYFG